VLGPTDGRYLVRDQPDGELRAVLVVRTLEAPGRRPLRKRRGRVVGEAEEPKVPTSRATSIRPHPFESSEEAEAWLSTLRRDEDQREAEIRGALLILNRAVHAQRVAAADPALGDLTLERALVARLGFGPGDEVAEGRFETAWEVPRPGPRTKRSMEAPEERFAAILAGRERALPAEELVLRARADLDAGRIREAALQARVGLESLLAELPGQAPPRAELEADRAAVGRAANAALKGSLDEPDATGVTQALERMERALKRLRLGA
jgi:hypothetical protein